MSSSHSSLFPVSFMGLHFGICRSRHFVCLWACVFVCLSVAIASANAFGPVPSNQTLFLLIVSGLSGGPAKMASISASWSSSCFNTGSRVHWLGHPPTRENALRWSHGQGFRQTLFTNIIYEYRKTCFGTAPTNSSHSFIQSCNGLPFMSHLLLLRLLPGHH